MQPPSSSNADSETSSSNNVEPFDPADSQSDPIRRPSSASSSMPLTVPLTMPIPMPARPPRQTPEKRDERCWITTKQTNARRALGREPQSTMYCYMNFRHAIGDLVPVIGLPGAYIARDQSPAALAAAASADKKKKHASNRSGSGSSESHAAAAATERDPRIPAYHWPALDGRYLYIARGKTAVRRHLDDAGGEEYTEENEAGEIKTKRRRATPIEEIEARCERNRVEREATERERRRKRFMGLEDDHEDYEKLIPLSSLYSTSLQRFHAHILRIYTPVFTNLARLPSTFTDGTQLRMLHTCYDKLTDGSAFTLAERLWDSTLRVVGTLYERRKREDQERKGPGGGGAGAGGVGGLGGPSAGGPGGLPPIPPVGGATPM